MKQNRSEYETPVEPHEVLRDGLIWGRWKPGQHLKPQHLKDELNCTTASLREALLRLAGEGLVESEKHHGFKAIEHSEETFRQSAHLRLVLESEGAAIAIANGDFEWEMALNAAHHNLAYVEEQMSFDGNTAEFLRRWSRQDWKFHSTLLSACNSQMLMRSYKTAFDTFRMYAVSQIANFGFSSATRAEHQAIYDAAVNRDSDACLRAIKTHLTLYEDDNRSQKRTTATSKS